MSGRIEEQNNQEFYKTEILGTLVQTGIKIDSKTTIIKIEGYWTQAEVGRKNIQEFNSWWEGLFQISGGNDEGTMIKSQG